MNRIRFEDILAILLIGALFYGIFGMIYSLGFHKILYLREGQYWERNTTDTKDPFVTQNIETNHVLSIKNGYVLYQNGRFTNSCQKIVFLHKSKIVLK